MSKKYNCILCNYDTSKLSNYNKHLLTKKHLRNDEKMKLLISSKKEVATSKTEDVSSKNEENSGENQMKCKYCCKLFYKSNKIRHYKRCKMKAKYELEEKTLQLEKELELTKEKQLELEKRNKEIQQDYSEALKIIMDSCVLNSNNVINSNNNNSKTINQVYIMNNFNDAYNFSDLMAPPLTAEEMELIKDDEAITLVSELVRCAL